MRSLRVWSVMEPTVATVEPGTPVDEAVRIALAVGREVLPVVANSELVGLVARHDLERVTSAHLVCECMITRVESIDRHASLIEAARVMNRCGCGCLAVEGEHVLRGVLTREDILRELGHVLDSPLVPR
jgi:CBS domain-containing protein